jgi:hypothetical protein
MVERLIDLGMHTGKHDFVPSVSELSGDLLRHWFRGYFDGDGGIGNTWPSVSIVGPEPFLQWVRKYLSKEIGTRNNILVRKFSHANCFHLNIGGRLQVCKFSDWIYKNASVFLERKQAVFESYRKPKLGKISNKNGMPTSSRYRGVTWRKEKKLYATNICVRGKRYFLGHFRDEQEAARAYDSAALEMLGDQARLNFQ